MYVHAVVLVKVQPGSTLKVIDELRRSEYVGMATAITGAYDLFVLIRSDTSVAMGQTIVRGIEGIPGVQDTVTHVVVSELETLNWLKGVRV